MSIEPTLEETTLEFLYGDGEADPGELVVAGAATAGYAPWLRQLEVELHALAVAVDASPASSEALARLRALRAEVEARSVGARGSAPVISLDAARARLRRTAVLAGGILAIAAGVLIAVVVGRGPDPTSGPTVVALRPNVEQAKAWASELDDGGLAFAGTERPLRDRGFLLGLVRDLAARAAEVQPGPSAEVLELARTLALQALAGFVDVDVADGEGALARALLGCAGALDSASGKEVAECERGVTEYVRHRDAALGRAP